MIRRPPRSTLSSSSAASDVYKRQLCYPIDTQTAVEDSLQLHGRHISAVFIQAPVVEPVQVRGRFRLDVVRIPPRPPRLDQLRLVQPIDRFSERIVMCIADRADRCINTGLEQALGEPHRRVLAASITVNLDRIEFGRWPAGTAGWPRIVRNSDSPGARVG